MSTVSIRVEDTPSQPQPLAGWGNLFRFMVRRDRLRAPIWIASIVGLVAASAASVIGVYDTPIELQQYADLAQADAALKAIAGPGHGLDNPTIGAVVMNETLLYTFIGIALMCIFLMIRHTRAEEETDRAELVRAASVGRLAILAAACVWVTIVDVAVSAGIAVSLLAFGLPAAGTIAFCLAGFSIGVVFIGVAATSAQIASSARAATGAASALLAASFILRAIGDLGSNWLTWLSPLGWAQSIRAFADERWWVLAPMGLSTIGLIACGVVLSARRDLGAGLFKQRSGPAEANPRLATPFAMAARLLRTSLISWTVGIALTGFFFGIVADQADEFLENEAVADMLALAGTGTPTEAFLAITVLMIALLTSGFTVSTVLRLRSEESADRAVPILAAPVSRARWLMSYLSVAALGTTAIMVVSGLAVSLGYSAQLGDASQVIPLLAASLAIVPALLVLAGITVALVGLHPNLSPLAWLGVVVSATVAFLAETLNLPQWSRNLSPFEHVPALPAAQFEILPILVLLLFAAGAIGSGLFAFGRRDVG